MRVQIPDLVENFNVSAWRRARRLSDRGLINFVNRLDFFRAADELEQVAVAAAFPLFQLLDHRRQQHVVHQGRFSRAGNSSDNGQAADRKPNIDILQIVGAGSVDLNPVLDRAQRSPRFASRVRQRRFQTATGLGILRTFEIAQRSGCDDFAAMTSRAGAEIDNVIGASHRFLVVLDDHERVSFFAQGREGIEQSQIVARMQADGGFVQNIKNAAQIRAELRRQSNPLRFTTT